MDCGRDTITLYSPQSDTVLHVLERDGVCFSRAEYVRRKYGESAPIFLTVYGWYVSRAAALVPPPEGAEYPYWAFANSRDLDATMGGQVLTLEVPRREAVFFDLRDWSRLLQLRFLGEEKEETAFRKELELRGLDTQKVMLSSFYPEWKQQIFQSWERLFRWHSAIQKGEEVPVAGIQAGLWCIRREWVTRGL